MRIENWEHIFDDIIKKWKLFLIAIVIVKCFLPIKFTCGSLNKVNMSFFKISNFGEGNKSLH